MDGTTTTWVQPPIASRPYQRASFGLAYDSARDRILLFGGDTLACGTKAWGDTWLYGSLSRASTAVLGTGCAGTAGIPVLASNEPNVGNRGRILAVRKARPAALTLFGLATGQGNLAFGQCTLYLQLPLAVVLFAQSSPGGFANLTLSVPLDRSLVGRPLYAQAFVVDPSAPPIGLSFTQGLQMRIGD